MNLPETATDLPLAARECYRAVRDTDARSQQEVADAAGVHRHTARRALETLEAHDLVRVEHSTRDSRERVYRVE